MKTKITPHGTMIQIEHNDKTYYGLLIVDFDLYKTFGNYDIDVEASLTLFDEDYDKIPYWEPIYEELSPIIEKIVVHEEDEDEEDDEL